MFDVVVIREIVDCLDDYDTLIEVRAVSKWFRDFADEKLRNLPITAWNEICESRKMSEDFLYAFCDNINFYTISKFQRLTENFIDEFFGMLNPERVIYYQTVSERLIEKYIVPLGDFYRICERQNLSIDFMRRHRDRILFNIVSIYQNLSEDFIDEFSDKVDWQEICRFQVLSEPFMEKHLEKLHWFNVSIYQKLSEQFIERYADRVNWYQLSGRQKLSYAFIDKHVHLINFDRLEQNWHYQNLVGRPEGSIEITKLN
jgi:hypothetical protein